VTVDCTIIYINLIIVGGIHQGVAAFDHAGTRGERLQDHELGDGQRDGSFFQVQVWRSGSMRSWPRSSTLAASASFVSVLSLQA